MRRDKWMEEALLAERRNRRAKPEVEPKPKKWKPKSVSPYPFVAPPTEFKDFTPRHVPPPEPCPKCGRIVPHGAECLNRECSPSYGRHWTL